MAQYERNSDGPGIPGMAFPAGGMAAMQGFANSVMRGNMEVMGLLSRRARAHMELPKNATACRTAAEVGQLGAQFWREAFEDYLHVNQRLMGLWMQNMAAIGQSDIARQAAEFANRVSEPMSEAVEETSSRMAEHPAEPWAWWRTDMKGLKPHRNGHSADEERGSRPGY